MSQTRTPAEVIAERLTRHLGPNTARTAVRTFADRLFGQRPEQVSGAEAVRLVDSLRPMLRTLLGEANAEAVIRDIRDALGRGEGGTASPAR